MRLLLAALLSLAACGGAPAQPSPSAASASPTAAARTPAATTAAPAAFLSMPLADVRTGETFRLGGFPGRVTLVQAMAVW
jgi:hypothetical protein